MLQQAHALLQEKEEDRMADQTKKRSLYIRQFQFSDIDDVVALLKKAYPTMPTMAPENLRGPLSRYPEGQFVAILDEAIIGVCLTFRISQSIALKPHSWAEITGNGFASRHDPDGSVLYGMEVAVDPDVRGLKIGQRLYDARKKLAREQGLKGIVFAGRMPGYGRRRRRFPTPEAYLEAAQDRRVRDSVIGFQLRNNFEPVQILHDYLPSDKESFGCAVLMQWHNPDIANTEETKGIHRSRVSGRPVRVATVQMEMRAVDSFEEFIKNVAYFTEVASDYRSDFVVFPELFTLQLLSAEPKKLTPQEGIEALTRYAEQFRETMRDLAMRYNINIIGGSTPVRMEGGDVKNITYVFLRDGAVHAQDKIHPTPNERFWWNIKGGTEVAAIPTDCGMIGVLICYDSEFPELARRLVDQGALILFVPFCTDERQSYLRVRYCAQARAVENQSYVVMAGNVGNLPNVENMDIQYAQSCILTPCDFPFARDGIAADTTPNAETVAFADLHLDDLVRARNSGTVTNLKDRRFDLYHIDWERK
ncbi:hydrolase YhcX [Iodidimonas nitroreducens]|uniref:Hydrolase YhcX n=2 Tax=Iodidimonas nitroreducens TaxID=1236968 RepID=A0A5A7N5D6_9PROT|nr:bifunctional GNAT family N-acetyltransferase/carbon-nitrogen hydrolase family protein [Iodidimonas nitroreducens]GAK32390.1 hydrolase YhcX [alpha proteobacterium Q-1]GER03187.1 hydrolase YhcX [Iodidimonas nitroreducens]